MQNQGTNHGDQCEQLARACEELACGFRQMADAAERSPEDWKLACESLREVLNTATGGLLDSALKQSQSAAAAAAAG